MWFGEFLIQNEVISHEQLTSALGRYHSSREPIGRLAILSGLLGIGQVKEILHVQADSPLPFGTIAESLGLLTHQEIEMLIGRQNQQTVWDFLVQEGSISKEAMSSWQVEFHRCNVESQNTLANSLCASS